MAVSLNLLFSSYLCVSDDVATVYQVTRFSVPHYLPCYTRHSVTLLPNMFKVLSV